MRDYHRPRYGNPLFPSAAAKASGNRRSTPNPRNTRRGSGEGNWLTNHPFLTAAALIVVGAAWYGFWGPAFRIVKVEFVGANAATEETLRGALDEHMETNALLIFPRNNVLLFGEDAAKDAVADAVYLDDIIIRKKLPDTLLVEVKEKTMRAVLESEGRLFGVDDSGYVLRELTGDERVQMPDLPPEFDSVAVEGLGAQAVVVPVTPPTEGTAATGDVAAITTTPPAAEKPATTKPVTPAKPGEETAAEEPQLPPRNAWPLILAVKPAGGVKAKSIEPGSQAFSPDTVSIALQANARLPDVTGEAVRWFVPDESADSVDATMATGWHVYLATTSPFEVQSDRLSIVLKEKIGTKRDQLEYVDLRYNERIFFRLKDGAT